MRAMRWSLVVGLAAVIGMASARLTLRAQVEPKHSEPAANTVIPVQEALERPLALPFGKPTRLDEVCHYLGRALHAPVVLDRAALDRQEVDHDDTVQLDLQGVRLKIGLKLLLDQLSLTYRVVPEDNLLILTDEEGSDDPLKQVLSELKALHRDVHDVQDAVDDILSMLGADEEGPKMRKPTIIEEVPANPAEKKAEPPAPAAPPAPAPRTRSGA